MQGDGGIIAVSKDGEIAMPYNTTGMFRAAADNKGIIFPSNKPK